MSMIVKKTDFMPAKLLRVRFAAVTELNDVRLVRVRPSGCCR